MKKMMILLSMALLLFSLVAFVGCSDKKAEEAAATIATHDCDGGCGMTNMPADKTTEIEGKFYCTGCAKHMQEGNHEGHNH